jgi:hypothetical protein
MVPAGFEVRLDVPPLCLSVCPPDCRCDRLASASTRTAPAATPSTCWAIATASLEVCAAAASACRVAPTRCFCLLVSPPCTLAPQCTRPLAGGGPTPLVQLRVGFVLTDLSEPGGGNLALIPGSHNSHMTLPPGLTAAELPIAQEICAPPGTAILFHQGTYHCGGTNSRPYNRYIQHMAYSAPWLVRSGRVRCDPAFLARTTPLRRMLLGGTADPGAEGGSYSNAAHAFHGVGPLTEYLAARATSSKL